MKIVVKEISWSGWNKGSSNETKHEYDIKTNQKIVVDSMNTSTYENGKEIFENNIIFAFKVIKVDRDYIKILVYGDAGGVCGRNKFKPRKFILKFNESITLKTNWRDAGKEFEVSVG